MHCPKPIEPIRIQFVVPGIAVGKKEGLKIGRKRDKRGVVRAYPYAYTEPKTRQFMAEVKAHALVAVQEAGQMGGVQPRRRVNLLPGQLCAPPPECPAFPTDDALAIEIVAFFPRPKSAPLTQKRPIAKPDATNIQKAVEDALHGVVFKNDSHVVDIHTAKQYCVNDMEPCTRVEIWTAGTLRDGAKS